MIKVAILDIGGTLIGAPDLIKKLSDLFPQSDAYETLKTTFSQLLNSVINGTVDFLTVEEIIQNTLRSASEILGAPDLIEQAGKIYSDTFVMQSYLYDDTISVLKYLKQHKIKIIAASDADAHLLYEELRQHKIIGYFECILTSSELRGYKPSEVFVNALKRETAEFSTEEVIFIGDADSDILTGQKLGIKTILIGDRSEVNTRPDYMINRLSELIDTIENLTSTHSLTL